MTAADRHDLNVAFYRAESLAHIALLCAMEQVDPRYAGELAEQIADEERHIGVFRRWLGDAAEPIRAPRPKQREQTVWFVTLLLNEVAGYCQFHMLAALVGEETAAQDVLEVARDEEVHIERLVRWLEPMAPTPAYKNVDAMLSRFEARLEGRMSQFLPRPELGELRQEMARITSELLHAVMPASTESPA